MCRPRCTSVFLVLFALALPARAAPPEPRPPSTALKAREKPAPSHWAIDRSLTLSPRTEPTPIFRYRLYPAFPDLKDGDAVPIYLRLVHERNDETRRLWREQPATWNKLPLDRLPVAEVRKFLRQNSYMMKQLELGARRKTAEWNYTLDAGDPIGILLPDAQMMRTYGAILVSQARLEIAEADYPGAAHTFQTGFRFSRQITEGPFLINGLVGIAVASLFSDALLDWIDRPDAPNLYWALTALPRPLINLRHEFELERRMVELEFPELADLQRERTPEEWDARLKRFRIRFARLREHDLTGPGAIQIPLSDRGPGDPAAKSPELPAARNFLVEHLQLAPERVQAMPPAQVLLLYLEGVNDEIQDDCYKGMYLPAWQAFAGLEAAQKRLKTIAPSEANGVTLYMTAAVNKVVIAQNRLDRRLAALRAIEAIRLYAAAHNGQLPDRLSAVTEVPVPNDPGTGKPFDYHREEQGATLIAPSLPVSAPQTGLRYRLKMREAH